MKRKIVVTLLSILLIVFLLTIITNTKNYSIKYTEIDGVKYAILVDGVPETSFPIGDYRVDVNCKNADGYWNNQSRKIVIKNIKGSVLCSTEFNSIESTDYLNSFVSNLSDTTQGDGNLIHEIEEIPDFSNSTTVLTYGSTPTFFKSTSPRNSQGDNDSYWTYNSATGKFTSNPNKMTNTAYYHVYAQVPEAGNYQICYTINQATRSNDSIYIYINSNKLDNFFLSTDRRIVGCYELGYLNSSDYINISEYANNSTSAPQITFRLEKSNFMTTLDTGYRFEGRNPNNYVYFNNEFWRIIGVFDENSHGQTGKNLVKIIRNNSIGGVTWNKGSTNNYPTSTIFNLLNKPYYDWNTYNDVVGSYCWATNYYNGYNVPANCDYSFIGIQDDYRSMIENVTWYLGGGGKEGYTSLSPHKAYNYERDSSAVYQNNSTSVNANIGLMYASDYLYAVLKNDCEEVNNTIRAFKSNNYYSNDCAAKNWLYSQSNEWVITPSSETNKVSLSITGNIATSYYVNNGFSTRPVVYLSEDVYRISGTGTMADPYIIGMATN